MQIALIVAAVIGVVVLAFVAKLLYDLLYSLRRLEGNVGELAGHKQILTSLPGQVAGEVRKGLQPVEESLRGLIVENRQTLEELTTRLETSHQHLDQALLTLDRDGYLGDWVSSFRETAEPFQLATNALTDHYKTSGELLSTTGELVRHWSDEREAVQLAFRSFSETVERSQAAETTHLRDIEHRVMNRLEEVAETNSTVSHALSELQVASGRTLEAHENLADTVRSTVDKVGELLDLGQRTQEQHHQLIRGQEAVQKRFTNWHEGMETRIERFQRHLEEIPVKIGMAFQQQVEKAVEAFARLGSQIDAFHGEHTRILDETARRQAAVVERQGELAELESRVLDKLRRQAGLLPTRNLQVATLALLAVQVVLLGIVALALG